MHWNDNYQIQDSRDRRGREGIAFREEVRRGLPKPFQCFFFPLKLSGGYKEFIVLFFIALSILKNFIIKNRLATVLFFLAVEVSDHMGELQLTLQQADRSRWNFTVTM